MDKKIKKCLTASNPPTTFLSITGGGILPILDQPQVSIITVAHQNDRRRLTWPTPEL